MFLRMFDNMCSTCALRVCGGQWDVRQKVHTALMMHGHAGKRLIRLRKAYATMRLRRMLPTACFGPISEHAAPGANAEPSGDAVAGSEHQEDHGLSCTPQAETVAA